MSDKAKIMDKIQKCLALSKSANEHEAAAALRQAQKLMKANGIDDAALAGHTVHNDTVDVPIQITKKGAPIHLTTLVHLISKAFGVKAVYESRVGISDLSYRIRYFGPATRVPTAVYAHKVVFRAMEAAWRNEQATNPNIVGVRMARASFLVGWLLAVEEKVSAIGFTDEEKNAVESAIQLHYGKLTKFDGNAKPLHGGMMKKGAHAASDFNLHRPVNGAAQRLLR